MNSRQQDKAEEPVSPSTVWATVGYWLGRHPVWTILLSLFVIGSIANVLHKEKLDSTQQQPSAAPPGTPSQEVSLPEVSPPRFRVFKAKTDVPTSYVVSVDTTDEQLKSLLWLFRQKVRAEEFKDIGITQPTAKQYGQLGYTSGMLVVYRGEKCANEEYISTSELEKGHLGPCGYGEHDDAHYQWGIDGDPKKDDAGITDKNGNPIPVFNYKDNWHPSSDVLKDFDQKVKEAWEAKQREWEPMQRSAVLITNKLNQKGINVTASANENQPKQLDLQSPLFKDIASREAFVKDGLPQIQSDLCHVGFVTIRILQERKSEAGQTYSLHCR